VPALVTQAVAVPSGQIATIYEFRSRADAVSTVSARAYAVHACMY